MPLASIIALSKMMCGVNSMLYKTIRRVYPRKSNPSTNTYCSYSVYKTDDVCTVYHDGTWYQRTVNDYVFHQNMKPDILVYKFVRINGCLYEIGEV